MNKELLERVAVQIETHPETLDMGVYECGTTSCIAGWAIKLSGGRVSPNYSEARNTGKQVLGITDKQADALFFAALWPDPFYRDYLDFKSPAGRARTAVSRIKDFIATEGRE